MDIRILPPTVAAQIAVGEVVENAIDADATQITVSIEQGGTESIRVQDNGSGIPADQVVTDFSRRATSKLRTADDLRNISTLGFRGEALPSIAAVSILTCVTCTTDDDAATRYRVNYGEPEDQPRPTGTAAGTSVTVENLFSNQPARLKFLRTKPTEAAHVQRVVARYAMACPNVRFTYNNDGNETFRTNGTGKLIGGTRPRQLALGLAGASGKEPDHTEQPRGCHRDAQAWCPSFRCGGPDNGETECRHNPR